MPTLPTLLHGDCIELMRDMPDNQYHAVITDPPYASGGLSTVARSASPEKKYINNGNKKTYPTFANDTRDQRSHYLWSLEWMREALRVTQDGGWLMVFSDWRQLPLTSDALQVAGWTWRGLIVWDKTEATRPQVGMHRNQCEYILTATKGKRTQETKGCPAGCFRNRILPHEKLHMTGKPVELMEHLMSVFPKESNFLDPFSGSGTTALAAQRLGHNITGIELSPEYHQIATNRLGLVLPA